MNLRPYKYSDTLYRCVAVLLRASHDTDVYAANVSRESYEENGSLTVYAEEETRSIAGLQRAPSFWFFLRETMFLGEEKSSGSKNDLFTDRSTSSRNYQNTITSE